MAGLEEKAAGTPELLGKSQVRQPVSGSYCCAAAPKLSGFRQQLVIISHELRSKLGRCADPSWFADGSAGG